MAKNTYMGKWGQEQQDWRKKQRKTLLELANLSDLDLKRFMAQVGSRYYWNRSLRSSVGEYRDDLRKIWSGDFETAQMAMQRWTDQANQEPAWFLSSGAEHGKHYWSVLPNYAILPLALVIGVSELQSKMAICENPGCPNKYFLKERKTQRFCDVPACAAYGQREHKRKWWSEHGKEWKESRVGSRRKGRKQPETKGESK